MTDARAEVMTQKPDGLSLAMNALPLALLVAGGVLTWTLFSTVGARLAFALCWLYLLPPLAGRLVVAAAGETEGEFAMPSRGFRVWWTLTQLQMVFNRLPVLEELLRLVPGLYPVWIGLWGGHASPQAFIGPGVKFTDRHLIRVERGALLGFQAALVCHMAQRDAEGRWQIVTAQTTVERDAIMGGGTALGPGARLLSGQMLPAGRRIGPFRTWPRASHLREKGK